MSLLEILALTMAIIVACLQIFFAALEMFFWHRGLGLRIFRQSYEKARSTYILALNQGFYNLILAAGLLWGLALGDEGFTVVSFFLGSVFAAGIFGGLTASRGILFAQATPAGIALALHFLS